MTHAPAPPPPSVAPPISEQTDTDRLVRALQDNNIPAAYRALGGGADAGAVLPNGETVLMVAALHCDDDEDLANFLMDCGAAATVNKKGPDGRTALMHAAARNKKHLARVCLNRGAAPGRRTPEGETAATLAPDGDVKWMIQSALSFSNPIRYPTATSKTQQRRRTDSTAPSARCSSVSHSPGAAARAAPDPRGGDDEADGT